jgi:glycosyltransferase involved in cell wall biosynthesis
VAVETVNAVFSLTGAQLPGNAGRGIGRYVSELFRALMDLEPTPIRGVWLDRNLPMPQVLSEISRKVEIISRGSDLPSDMSVFHLTSPMDRVDFDTLWPRAVRLANLPTVATVYDLIPLSDPITTLVPHERRRYRARLSLIQSVDMILAISDHTALQISSLLDIHSHKIRTVGTGRPNKVNSNLNDGSQIGSRQANRYILASGNLESRKNILTVLHAFAKAKKRLASDISLVVHCSSNQAVDSIRRRCEDLGLNDVSVLGSITDDELSQLYHGSECFVFPSLREGFGLPIVEAQTLDTTALAAQRPPMRELLRSPNLAFNPFSAESLAEQLISATEDPNQRAASSNETHAPPHLTWKDVALNVTAAYETVARGSNYE